MHKHDIKGATLHIYDMQLYIYTIEPIDHASQ